MLNRCFVGCGAGEQRARAWFSRPLLGAASSSQAMAPRNGGVTNEAVTSVRTVPAQRHVGARHEPAHRRGDDAADRRPTLVAIDQRREQRLEERRVGEQRGEVGERRSAVLVGEGVDDEPRHRQHDQHAQDRGERDQHRHRQVEAAGRRRRGGRRYRRGHDAGLTLVLSHSCLTARRYTLNSLAYFSLISSACFSTASGSSFISLISLSGLRPG